MTTIDDIIETDINQKLKGISVANGYLNDVTILPGYLVHYANDLIDGKDGLSFPAVAFQPIDDDPETSHDKTKAKNHRSMKLLGAVSVRDRDLVNKNINSLLFDVRRAIAMNKYNNNSQAMEIEIGKADFNLPDSQDSYAFFEMPITIKYIEVWLT